VARALLVGCGCAAREAGAALLERGWAVRGSSRSRGRLDRIADAGIEPVLADPDRVGSIVELLADVTVLAWLPAAALSDPEALQRLNGERLGSLLEKLVDTPVRGVVYVAPPASDAGSDPGRALLADAEARWRIPVRIVERGTGDGALWASSAAVAVEAVIAPPTALSGRPPR
jgi:nucleoside-diphosphate-sugar epimerase